MVECVKCSNKEPNGNVESDRRTGKRGLNTA